MRFSEGKAGRDRLLLLCMLLLTATLLVFWKVRAFDFVRWDDNILVYENPYYQKPNLSVLSYFWTHAHRGLYMPITYSAWGVVAVAATIYDPVTGRTSLDPHVFHSLNLMLHSANILLVFALLRRILVAAKTEKTSLSVAQVDWSAFAGALLFAIHPLQAESVAWVSELKGLLCAFFSLLALWFYFSFAIAQRGETSEDETPERSRAGGMKPWLLATLYFGCALLSKPSAVVVPLLAVCLSVGILRLDVSRVLRPLVPWFALTLVCIVIAGRVQPTLAEEHMVTFWSRLLIAADATVFYLGKLFYPSSLTINYGRTPQWALAQSWIYLPLLLIAAVAFLVWSARIKFRWLCVAFAMMLVVLLPNMGFVPFQFQGYSTVADRYFYLAMIGPSLALSSLVALVLSGSNEKQVKSTRTLSFGLAGLALLGALGMMAQRQTMVWSSDKTLFTHAIAVNSRDWASLQNQGSMLLEAGRTAEAEPLLKEAHRLKPESAIITNTLANIYIQRGDVKKAIPLYQRALSINPISPGVHANLAMAWMRTGATEAALKEFKNVLVAYPGQPQDPALIAQANFYISQILWQRGDRKNALTYARQAVEVTPLWTAARISLGLFLTKQGKIAEAAEQYGAAIRQDPRSNQARRQLALLMLRQSRRTEAVALLREALALQPNDVLLKKTLQSALAAK